MMKRKLHHFQLPDQSLAEQVIDKVRVYKVLERGALFLNNTVRYILIGVVTTMWVFNLLAPTLPFLKGYNPDPSINAVFMIVIGALFGADAWGRVRGGGNGEDTEQKVKRKVGPGNEQPEEGGS